MWCLSMDFGDCFTCLWLACCKQGRRVKRSKSVWQFFLQKKIGNCISSIMQFLC